MPNQSMQRIKYHGEHAMHDANGWHASSVDLADSDEPAKARHSWMPDSNSDVWRMFMFDNEC